MALRTEQHLGAEFRAINPQSMVPALVHDGTVLIRLAAPALQPDAI